MKKAYSLFALAMLAVLASCEKKQEVTVEQPVVETPAADSTATTDAAAPAATDSADAASTEASN